MKEDEKLFFVLCFQLRMLYGIDVRNIINILQPFINKKRLWYLLEKWFKQGFYDFGVKLDLGWFEIEKIPNRYSDLLFIYCPYRYNNPLCKCRRNDKLVGDYWTCIRCKEKWLESEVEEKG